MPSTLSRRLASLMACSALLMAAACAQAVWVKDNASAQQGQADLYACERDARQSGGFGGGLVGAIALQEFFNRCMRAKGYDLRDQEAHARQLAIMNNALATAGATRRRCVADVRAEPRFAALAARLPDPSTGRYGLAMMADGAVPSAREAAEFISYYSEVNKCQNAFFHGLVGLVPERQIERLRQARADQDALAAQLGRRQMTWGEFAARTNQMLASPQGRSENGP